MTGTDVVALRRKLQMTQAQFAALVGVTRNTVARWERDAVSMPDTTGRLIEIVTRDLLAKMRATTTKQKKTAKRPTRKTTKRTK